MKYGPVTIMRKVMSIPRRVRNLEEKLYIEQENNRKQQAEIQRLKRQEKMHWNALLPQEQYPKALAIWYFERTGQRLDFSNPRTYNEKIQWFKLYGVTKEIVDLADKYKVRDFVAERIGEEYLVPLLGVWKYPEEIDIAQLPNRFVLKANHGCGYNYIVTDKAKLDIEDMKRKANQWLQEDFSFVYGFEMQYHGIEPLLIAEQYLENVSGDLYDYKVWCFNGRAEFIMFLSNRKNGLKMDFYDREWNHLPFTYNYPNSGIQIDKPDNLDELIEKAEKLAEGFPHVRVDFYRMNSGKLYFGEMTFTSASGACKWDPPETDLRLGRLFDYNRSEG